VSAACEYLDLMNLGHGVQWAKAAMATATMAHILPRSAVSDETWRRILVHLAGEPL